MTRKDNAKAKTPHLHSPRLSEQRHTALLAVAVVGQVGGIVQRAVHQPVLCVCVCAYVCVCDKNDNYKINICVCVCVCMFYPLSLSWARAHTHKKKTLKLVKSRRV